VGRIWKRVGLHEIGQLASCGNPNFHISGFSLGTSDKNIEGMDGGHLVVNFIKDDQGN
jgi:hypothetical protein